MNKAQFVEEVDGRLGEEFPGEALRCVEAVFHVLHERIPEGQAGHIETHLPEDLKDPWRLGVGERVQRAITGRIERRDLEEFLAAVQQEAGLALASEADRATRAVFGELKQLLPEKDVRDTGAGLPQDLRELWTEAR